MISEVSPQDLSIPKALLCWFQRILAASCGLPAKTGLMVNHLLRISQHWKIPVMMLIVPDIQSPLGLFFFCISVLHTRQPGVPRKQPPSSAPVRHLGRNASHLNLPPPPWSARHRLTSTVASLLASKAARKTWKTQSNTRHQSCRWCLQNAKCYQKYGWTWSSVAPSFPQAKLYFQLCVALSYTQIMLWEKTEKKNTSAFFQQQRWLVLFNVKAIIQRCDIKKNYNTFAKKMEITNPKVVQMYF